MDETPNELEQTDYIESQSLDYGAGVGGLAGTNYASSPVTGTPEMVGFGNTGDMQTDMDDDGDEGDDEVSRTRQQIEDTRSQMSTTIDAIQERLSPEHLVQQAKDTVYDATVGKATDMVSNAGDTAAGFGGGIVETIKENPIPAALAGLGIGWLLISARKNSGSSSQSYTGYRSSNGGYGTYTGGSYGGGYSRYASDSAYGQTYDSESQSSGGIVSQAQGAVGNVTDAAQNVAGQVQSTAGQVTGQVQDAAGQVISGAQQGLSQVSNQAQQGVQQAQSGFQRMLRENPLGLAAGAVALGLAVGLAVPETQKENELFGDTRDQLVDQAQQMAQEKAQQVQQVAQQTVSAAASAAKDTAQQAASDQGLTQ